MKGKWFFVLLMAGMSVLCNAAEVEQTGDQTRQAEKLADSLIKAVGMKFSPSIYYEKFRALGKPAVPVLIARYKQSNGARWLIASCLCEVPYDPSREFLLQIIREGKDKESIREIVQKYPQLFDVELFPVLLQYWDGSAMWDMWVADRLRQSVERNPFLAGQLVAALSDEKSDKNSGIYKMLAGLCGRSECWRPAEAKTPAGIRTYWKDWWRRYKNMGRFHWVRDAMYDTDSPIPVERALHIMAGLRIWLAMPVFREALDYPDSEVRYWAVVGLRNLENQNYTYGQFLVEEFTEIQRLKGKYAVTGPQQASADGSALLRPLPRK